MYRIVAKGMVQELGALHEWVANGKEKRNRMIVIREDGEKWPRDLAVTFWGHDADKLLGIEEGMFVEIVGEASSREATRPSDGARFWNTSVVGRNIEVLG